MKTFTSPVCCVMVIVMTQLTFTRAYSCSNNSCEYSSYQEIMDIYSGIFLTTVEIQNEDAFRSNMNGNSLARVKPNFGDGDACCPTEIKQGFLVSMKNVKRIVKSIVHMPDAHPARYQYIPQGACVEPKTCNGRCILEKVLLTLLVVDGDKLLFDYFIVPGYCSCKNVNPRRRTAVQTTPNPVRTKPSNRKRKFVRNAIP